MTGPRILHFCPHSSPCVQNVVMPQMGGLECLRRLREMDPQVKVLISIGYTVRGLAEELVAEGALGVVGKPFQLRDFATAVRAALDRDPNKKGGHPNSPWVPAP